MPLGTRTEALTGRISTSRRESRPHQAGHGIGNVEPGERGAGARPGRGGGAVTDPDPRIARELDRLAPPSDVDLDEFLARAAASRRAGRGPRPALIRPATLGSMAQQLGSFEKVLRLGEGRRLKRLAEQAAYIGTLEPEFEPLSDEELAAKTVEFRERIEQGETVEEVLFEAFAAVREAFKRTLGVRLFDVQLMGGIVLHE